LYKNKIVIIYLQAVPNLYVCQICLSVLHTVFFCVPQKKENNTGLERLDGE